MIGSGELIVILCVILLLFGGKKLPEFAKNLGKGIREFKNACNGISEEEAPPLDTNAPKSSSIIPLNKDDSKKNE